MSIKKKIKKLKQTIEMHEEILVAHTGRMAELEADYKPYTGALQMTLDRDPIEHYLMVTDLHVDKMFLEFYHLIPFADEDKRTISVNSFDRKPNGISAYKHMQNIYSSGRWVAVKQKIMIDSFAGISLLGEFKYSKVIRKSTYPFKNETDNTVVLPVKRD